MASVAFKAAKKLPSAIAKLKKALAAIQKAASAKPTVEALPSKTLVRTGKFVKEAKNEQRKLKRLQAKQAKKESALKLAAKNRRRRLYTRVTDKFNPTVIETPSKTISRTGKFARERSEMLSSPDLGGFPKIAKAAVKNPRSISKAVHRRNKISNALSSMGSMSADLGGLHPIAIRMLRNRKKR